MREAAPILAITEASLPIEPDGGITAPITLRVLADELVLIELGRPQRVAAFADIVCGTLEPRSGRVTFLGRDWRAELQEKADALRGRIGRLFGADPWIPWLTVAENVLLAPLYHTREPREALLAEAERLALRFGLPGLPVDFPETLAARDLARAAFVRAFLGPPRLVVLENPPGLAGPEILPGPLAEIRALRDGGGAVLWLAEDLDPALARTLPTTQRLRLAGSRLVPATARAA
jgi:phospholipid/cholesterol/gamma-HCH transport system ATP-binding protein